MVRAGKVRVYKNLIAQLTKIKGNITEIRIIGVSILLHASKDIQVSFKIFSILNFCFGVDRDPRTSLILSSFYTQRPRKMRLT